MTQDFQNFLAVVAAVILVSWYLTYLDLKHERETRRRRGKRRAWWR